ncbi:MAG: holo-ACP synthase [Pontibacterium sp.]
MIKGVGTDICEIARISAALSRRPALAQRILTANEYAQFSDAKQPERFLAKRFAAKEAISKALGTGIGRGVSWHHIELSKAVTGQPIVQLSEGAQTALLSLGGEACLLSYSDEQHYVVAFAVVQ